MPLNSIFVSASIPDPQRNPQYFTTGDSVAIRDAVVSLMLVALPRTRVVFGGHPAITPMVKWVADELNKRATDLLNDPIAGQPDFFDKVQMFQSMHFRQFYVSDIQKFGYKEVVAVQNYCDDRENREASLRLMREMMLASETFSAAFFIGGMEGIEAEYATLRALHQNVPCFPIYTTGAAARMVWDMEKQLVADAPPAQRSHEAILNTLRHDNSYTSLFTRILDSLDNGDRPAVVAG